VESPSTHPPHSHPTLPHVTPKIPRIAANPKTHRVRGRVEWARRWMSVATPLYPNRLSLVYRYSCKANKCADESDFTSHADVMGCRYFCMTDTNGDGEISRAEIVAPFLKCTGGNRGKWSKSVSYINMHDVSDLTLHTM